MTRTFKSKDKLYTFTATECTVLRTVDFDFTYGREIVERQSALLVEWENSRGLKLNAIGFYKMPTNDDEFEEIFANPNEWTTDYETLRTAVIESN